MVAANVRRLREARGMSQEELAHSAEFARTYISNIERGQVNLSFANAVQIAEALGVEVGELTLR